MASPATEKLLQGNSEELGVPDRVRRFTWMDLGAVAVVLLAFVVALNAVLYKPTALLLGQTNQLILKLLLVYEARAGKSTLQNFDAILRTDYFSKAVSLRPRIVLLFLFALPLGLGVSYKKFSGGSTSIEISNTGADFGFTAAPGYQLIGNGLSLLVDAYLPFWIKPSLGRTYGFNLYVAADNKTAAILDAPLPKDLSKLQASLNDHESMNITATVNATVTENIDPSAAERYDYNGYWHEKALMFDQNGLGRVGAANGAYQDMWASTNCSRCNYTEVFLSLWNVTKNQSFYSEVERFVSTRRTCQGVWKLTRLNVSLVDVAYLQSADEIDATQNQDVIANVINSVKPMFFPFLGEYDWKTREAWDQPLPGNSDPGEPPQFFPVLNTRPALVAAMLWARTTSNVGPERPYVPSFASGLTSYSKDASYITLVKQGLTLQRSPWLIVVLAVHPILTIIAVLAKAALSTTPIGDGFGLISLLAGIREEGLEVLRGAALSGKLSQKVRIRFTASKAEGLDYERLHLDLGSQAKSGRLDPKVRYG